MKISNDRYRKIFVVICCCILTSTVLSQGISELPHKGEENKGGAGFEAVSSGVFIYTPESGHFDPATEFHFTYWTSHTWAIGTGYTLIYEEGGRVAHELAPLLSHKPWPIVTLNIGPSFAFANSERDFSVSAYLEAELNIGVGRSGLHTGPVLGTLLGDEFRYFAGVHLGYEF